MGVSTQVTLAASFLGAGQAVVAFLPAGPPNCTGALDASLSQGGLLPASGGQLTLTPAPTWGPDGGVGYYRLCCTRVLPPTSDGDFSLVPGALLLVDGGAPPTKEAVASFDRRVDEGTSSHRVGFV